MKKFDKENFRCIMTRISDGNFIPEGSKLLNRIYDHNTVKRNSPKIGLDMINNFKSI